MRLVFSNSHPSDLLAGERAGHLVRARNLLDGLETLGHEVTIVEAAAGQISQAAASAYRGRLSRLPDRIEIVVRDAGRLVQSAVHGWRVGAVASSQQADAIVETHNALSIAGLIASRRSGCPLVLDDLTPSAEDDTYYQLGLRRTARWIRRLVLRRARLAVTVSAAIESSLIAEGVAPARVAVVPNGVPSPAGADDRARWREILDVADDQRILVYVGSFQRFHEVPLLIRALGNPVVPASTVVVLVGDGETRAECESLAGRELLPGRTRFVGRLPHDQIPALLAAADAAVLPGTAEYMNPMKLYEYVAAGLPTAAPDQQAVRQTLIDTRGIRFFEPGDQDSCAEALVAVLDDQAARPEPTTGESWIDRARALARLIEAIDGTETR